MGTWKGTVKDFLMLTALLAWTLLAMLIAIAPILGAFALMAIAIKLLIGG